MKTRKLYLFLVLNILCRFSYCDLIPVNSHAVDKCVEIINVENYPDISLVGVISSMLMNGQSTYLINPSTCLDKGYRFNCVTIYAVNNSYLAGKDINTINWSTDQNAFKANIQIDPGGGYADNSNPIKSIKQYYRIVGFTANSVVLYKCREVDYFYDGTIALSGSGKYSGDSTILSQFIPVGQGKSTSAYNTTVNLFPNKLQKTIQLKLSNNYHGPVSVKIYTMDGKPVNTFSVNKSETRLDYNIHAEDLAKGSYFVNISLGLAIETKKIVIE